MTTSFQSDFLAGLDQLGGLELLFENLPNMSFFVKDYEGHFVLGNQSVARICGCKQSEDIIGQSDFDFFPKYIADHFRQDDLMVMQTGQRIVQRIEPISLEDGSIHWYATNKVPIYASSREVVGIAGITQHLERAPVAQPDYMEFAGVIEHIHKHFGENIAMDDLARMASLSLSQFERRFKRVFQETPMQFILKVRINEACKALVQTRNSVSWIAQATGFCDQSYFSKQFMKRLGMAPREYRKQYFQGHETKPMKLLLTSAFRIP